jgi:hypothetical protein
MTGHRTTHATGFGLFLLALTMLPAAASGRVGQSPEANLIRLEGHLGPPQHDDKGASDLHLRYRTADFRMQVQTLHVLTGKRLAGSILSDVKPYRSAFLLQGADTMLQRLRTVKPSDRVTITGIYRRGSRTLLVNEVTIASPTAPPGAAPPH